MKIFALIPEPDGFDKRVRQPGITWLNSHPSGSPRAYWNEWVECRFHLADGFRYLCGYSLIHTPVGTIDHFISSRSDRSLAYEWKNYRYADGWINSCKQDQDATMLDPFEVEDDWFEILLPSMQMVLAERLEGRISAEQYQRARNTLERLHLVNDPRARNPRRVWYQAYLQGKITLEGLDDFAPLLARAIRKQQAERLPED